MNNTQSLYHVIVFRLWAVLLLAILFSYTNPVHAQSEKQPQAHNSCARIVSFAPSITHILTFLELENTIVGKSSFDTHTKIQQTPVVGDLYAPNIEKIKDINPGLILVLTEHVEHQKRFRELSLPFLVVDHRNITGIKESALRLIKHCKLSATFTRKLNALNLKEKVYRRKYAKKTQKQVLLIIGSNPDVSEFYISGNDGFYADVLNIINAENVFKSKTASKLSLSKEGLLSLNPDALFYITSRSINADTLKMKLAKENHLLPEKIFIYSDKMMLIPGLHYLGIAKSFARSLG